MQMPRLVSWPMYAPDPASVGAFWLGLRHALNDCGFAALPADLTEPEDLPSHWRHPALLLSQTCGYPFVTSLAGAVRYVATPRFAVPGCEDGFYRSAIVVRNDEPAESIAAMAGRRAAFNSRDSQSGYNAFRALVAPYATAGRFFGDTVETGAHRHSLRAVASGAADLAAIDAVTLALLGDHAPAEIAGLRILSHTASAPGLPFVTAASTSDADLARLRRAVAQACRRDAPAAAALRLDGVAVMPHGSYDAILAMQQYAEALDYPTLA